MHRNKSKHTMHDISNNGAKETRLCITFTQTFGLTIVSLLILKHEEVMGVLHLSKLLH
jgi:hypothetical protein